MKLAYLLNSYPMTSTTFIRREIEAIERHGLPVERFAVRHWDVPLIDQADIAEQKRTHYLLTGNGAGLLSAFLRECVTNPGGLIRTIGPWWTLFRSARGGLIRHIAYLAQAAYFRQQANKKTITHVHSHFATNAAAVAMLSNLLGGPNYSFMVHGPDELTDAPLLQFPMKVQHAAFVAAISNFCRSQIIRFGGSEAADKIEIIHCALDLSEFHPAPPSDNQTFVCVGRLCPQKGQSQFPAIAERLRGDFPNLKIILVGDGESRPEIESEIARRDVADNVILRGWMDNAAVRKEIIGARCFLLPSYAEGLPVVIMEAMALGRPVISTYIAGIPELLDSNCGWIIPAGSPDDLEKAMRAALTTPIEELARLGAEGRGRIEVAHDIDIEAKRLSAKILGNAGSSDQ